jgi:cytochrome c oxidase subunit IV
MLDQERHEKPTTHRRPNYVLVFVALTVITILEVAVTYVPGIPLAPILLSMTVAKALLVILYFMHLRVDSPWYSAIFFGPMLALVVPLVWVMLAS